MVGGFISDWDKGVVGVAGLHEASILERNRVLAAMTVQGKERYNVPLALGFLEQRRCFRVMFAKRCSDSSEGNYFDWQKYFGVGVRRLACDWPEIKLGTLRCSRRIPPFRARVQGQGGREVKWLISSSTSLVTELSSTSDALKDQRAGSMRA